MKQLISPDKIKEDFPIFKRVINGYPLVYLDNAATSQKPQVVLDSIVEYYSNHNANVHRGVHTLSDEATELYESARDKVAKFIGASKSSEVIFTGNSTAALNLVSNGLGKQYLKKGDVILVSSHEHNSNILPWIQIAKDLNAHVEIFDIEENYELTLNFLRNRLSLGDVKVLAMSHASNVLGNIFPVKEISSIARDKGVLVVVDGSQAIPHLQVDVQSLGCDFYAFSSHKMLGPMGIGVLWGRGNLLEEMPPTIFGGGMVLSFDLQNPVWQKIPEKFEAGTPNVSGAVGLSVAIDYLNKIGIESIRNHEVNLNKYTLERLKKIKNLHILGTEDPTKRTGLVSFYIDGIHSHDIAAVLNANGIAVRSGMHCAMYLHKQLNIPASTRASYYLYNSKEDINALIEGLEKCQKILN